MSDHLRDRLVAAVGEHYLIEAELGRGGMAAVYRALDVRLNRRVAIKVLPPELAFNHAVRTRFLREAQMAARLTHPSIVPIYSVDERDGLVYFVMALVEGESVAARLSYSGAMPVDDVRSIIGAVADALDYAHGRGVIHRDIKPDNILIDRASGRPMVTDFGIARAAAEEQRLTVSGMAVGTPAYMSPEQAMGEREVDGRSDLYSLAIVAYQMLAGETPFKATNTPAMLMKHVSEPPPPLRGRRPDVPPGLAHAIERSLAKRPEDRWVSAGEMRDAVLEKLAGVRSAPPPPLPDPSPFARQQLHPGLMPMGSLQPAPVHGQHPLDALSIALQPPPNLSRKDLRKWYRQQRDLIRAARRAGYRVPELPVDERISRFRRQLVGYGATSLMLFGINAAMGGFPWFIFPAGAMAVSLIRQLGAFWGDGIPLRSVFFGANKRTGDAPVAVQEAYVPRATIEEGLVLVPREVLTGGHGAPIQRAAASRQIVMDMLSRMTAKEREMLPADIERTVKALFDRVVSVGTTLHRLDADANGASLGSLDSRVAGLKAEPQSNERDRRLALLERQRATLRDLLDRRATLLTQFESATVALENLKLDLVRFRSAGVSSALEDVSSATREARAVSRDIGHMLDAADEVRKL